MSLHSIYIRYFDRVRRHGSIRKASEDLHVASSAVSRQILKLEDELGVSLFERSPSGVKLTKAGEVFSQFVDRTISDVDHILGLLDELKTDDKSRISIAAQESVVAEFLPTVLLQFNDQFPEIETTFTTTSGKKLIGLLNDCKADIAIIFDPEPNANIKQIITQQLRVKAVMATSHSLASNETLTLEQCADYPMILPDESWPLRDTLNKLLAQSALQPNILSSSNSVAFIRRMLTSEQCIGFQTVVGIERQVNEGGFITIPLQVGDDTVTQDYTLCQHKKHKPSEPLQALIGLLRNRFEEYARYY